MNIKRRKKLHVKTPTRVLIVDEAERIIANYGIDDLRLDDIANNLGIQRPSLYAHFKGRDGILTAVAERAFIQLSHQFQDDENADPIVTISRGVDELVDFLIEHKACARLLARDFSTPGGLPAVNEILGPMEVNSVPPLLEPLEKRVGKIIVRGHKLGKFQKFDPFLFITILLGAIMSCLLQHRKHVKKLNISMKKLALGLLSVNQ